VPIPLPSPEEIEPDREAFHSGLPLEKVDWEYTEERQAATATRKEDLMQADIIV
jgi:hypothetical protein